MIGSVKRQLMTISLGLLVCGGVLTALSIRAQQKQQEATPQSTPTPAPPRPALKVVRGVENPAALDKFFRSLSTVKRRIEPVRIMHFGDSHTAADILTAEIRRNFQREFGDGGAGYMIPRNPQSTPRRG